jgi:hypothetical protein
VTVIQTQTKAPGTGHVPSIAPAVTTAAIVLLMIVGVILATALTSRQGLTSKAADPNTKQAAVEFRAAEHAAGLIVADPLLDRSAIEFRAGERSASGAVKQSNPRAGEHPAGALPGDRLPGGFPGTGHGK